jgi:hypothetical protein
VPLGVLTGGVVVALLVGRRFIGRVRKAGSNQVLNALDDEHNR